MEPLTGNRPSLGRFQVLAAPEPWEAYLLPLPVFPLVDTRMESFRSGIQQLAQALTQRHALQQGLVLQVWKLSGKNGGDLLQEQADRWPFDLGFGVWPNRPSPEGWTEDSIQDAAAAVYRGDEPHLPMHRILLFTIHPQDMYLDAVRQLSGFGATIQIFTRATLEEVRENGRNELLSRVKDSRFRGGKVYLPLLDSESLVAARDANELEQWMCGGDVYLRESAEDKGFLLVSRLPIERLLDEFGSQF